MVKAVPAELAARLLRLEIERRRPVVDAAAAGGRPGDEEHRIGQRRLADAALHDDAELPI
jgi:hypothetical protein